MLFSRAARIAWPAWMFTLISASPLISAVNLELRPAGQTVVVGTTVEVELYATAGGGSNETVGYMTVVLTWDATWLTLTGVNNNGPYFWLDSGFPDDSMEDGLNDSFSDGDALYRAAGVLGSPATATPAGLLITTLLFTAADTTALTTIQIVPQIEGTQTLVFSDTPPFGMNVTGTLGSANATIICQTAGQCNDQNPCTDESCVSQACQHVPNDANNPDDGLYCNGVEDSCSGGMIVYEIPPPDCDDSLSCTTDSCDEMLDACANSVNAGQCAIEGACYFSSTLNPMNDCQVCNPSMSQTAWSNRSLGTSCGSSMNTDCDNPDTCDGAGTCQQNLEADGTNCADEGNVCTLNECQSGVCQHPPGPAGVPCGSGIDNTCTDPDTCDAFGVCQGNHATDGTICDDALFCTTSSSCQSGSCGGTGDACPGMVCDEQTDSCKAVNLEWRPIAQTVVRGDTFNVRIFAVSGTGSNMPFNSMGVLFQWDPANMELLGNVDNGPYDWLISGFPDDCNLDGINAPCTGLPDNDGDAYFHAIGQFTPMPAAEATPAGLHITTLQFEALAAGVVEVEFAASIGSFLETTVADAVTPGLSILAMLGPPSEITILDCVNDGQCNDGLYCTGAETCVATQCVAGMYPCGTLYCKESNDTCVECLTNEHCIDELFCNGVEQCFTDVCFTGTYPCPGQLCDEDTDTCLDCFVDGDCDDGFACTSEICIANVCQYTPDTGLCDDGLFCNGPEVCVVGEGCVPQGNPCPDPDTCQEGTDNCGGCDVSSAAGEGCRYVAVTPPAHPTPVALLMEGEISDDDVSCVSLYVQADGTVGETAVFQMPATWGTVHVRGEEIIPDSNYVVHTDCGTPGDPLLAVGSTAQTWVFGDVNDSGDADTEDLILVVDAESGVFKEVTVPNVDLYPCVPDGMITSEDIMVEQTALQGLPLDCPQVCYNSCDAPIVVTEGLRYLALQPAAWPEPVRFLVTPLCEGAEPRYVGAPGDYWIAQLVDDPMDSGMLTPMEWGSIIHVTGVEIAPDTDYEVQAVCGSVVDPRYSAPIPVTTWLWGDLNGTDVIDVDDISCVLDGFSVGLPPCGRYQADVVDCLLSGVVDVDDISAVLDAYSGFPFPCPEACP